MEVRVFSPAQMKKWLLLTAAALISAAYFIFNRPIGTVHILATSLDGRLPVWPILGLPYLVFIPILWLTVLWAFWRNKEFEAVAWSLIVVHLIAFTVFLLFQSEVLRPVVNHNSFGWPLLAFIYSHDGQYAAFPSLHTTSAVLLALYFYRIKSSYVWLMAAFCLIVISSTVLLKQHYLADIVAGLILGLSVGGYYFFGQS